MLGANIKCYWSWQEHNMALTKFDTFEGYLGQQKLKGRVQKYMVFDDKAHEIHRIIVHRFRMGDVDDPDLYAAQPLIEWQESEMGKWVMERSVETPMWHRHTDHTTYGYQYAITAHLKGQDYTYWQLKWGSFK